MSNGELKRRHGPAPAKSTGTGTPGMPEGGNAGKLEGSPAYKPSHALGKAELGIAPLEPVPVFRATRIGAQVTDISMHRHHYTDFSCLGRKPGAGSVARLLLHGWVISPFTVVASHEEAGRRRQAPAPSDRDIRDPATPLEP